MIKDPSRATGRSPQRNRRSIRLKGYDYSQPGAYFVTICTRDRVCLFGDVVDGEMVLNALGVIIRDEWFRSADIRREIQLFDDEFVVMPNHIHGIVWIVDDRAKGEQIVGAHRRAPLHRAPKSLSSFVAGFKSAATKRINQYRGTPGVPVWQRNYYEHIIRNDVRAHGHAPLHRIREYIVTNPLRWHLDRENPDTGWDDPEWESWV